MTNFIDYRLNLISIKDKGIGYTCTQPISGNTVIIKEKPVIYLKSQNVISDIFEILHQIMTSSELIITKFNHFAPHSINTNEHHDIIMNELNRIKDTHLYDFFIKKYSIDEIILMSLKYICNCFDLPKLGPCVSFIGCKLNHSCYPNVVFGFKDGFIQFVTTRHISPGEELCDNYVNLTHSIQVRQYRLLHQYNFKCVCPRCVHPSSFDHKYQSIIKVKNQFFKLK